MGPPTFTFPHTRFLPLQHSQTNMSDSVGNEESYVTKEEQVPVQDDDETVEGGVDEATADSDAQLGITTPPGYVSTLDTADHSSRTR